MQAPSASPLKIPHGLPLPSSPADSGFLPRKEFQQPTTKKPLSTFSLVTFTATSSLRLSCFPPPIVQTVHKFLDERKLLKSFRDNRDPMIDKERIERDRWGEVGPIVNEEEYLAEVTLTAKFWANAKSVESERLLVQILVLLNSLGYTLLTSIDFAREPNDKLTLVFEKHAPAIGAGDFRPYGHQTNGSTSSHQQFQPPQPHHQHSGSLSATSPSNSIKQHLFALSFTSQTTLRCICPPLESTPGLLQALRNAWPKGVENEAKVGDGCWEFRLKGYAFFADDTFPLDSLILITNLLKSLSKLQFTLVASVSLSNSHARNKDLWLFSTTDTDTLTPNGLLNSIQSSPISYSLPASAVSMRQGSGEDQRKMVGMGHGRSASADTTASNAPPVSGFTQGHQRHPTAPAPILGPGPVALSPANTINSRPGPGPNMEVSSMGTLKKGSVLVKKRGGAEKSSPMVGPGGLPYGESNTPPSAVGGKSTPPGNKVPTPPGQFAPPAPYASNTVGAKPLVAPKPMPPQVLYSSPAPGGGDVLYSTGPEPKSPTPSHTKLKPSAIDIPPQNLRPPEADDEGPTPPLLSSTTFRDTMLDREADKNGDTSMFRSSRTPGRESVRSGESYDVPVMWTGTGALGGLSQGVTPKGLSTTVEEDETELSYSKSPESPTVPGGWVDETSTVGGSAMGGKMRGKREKERTVDAKVEGAQIVNRRDSEAAGMGVKSERGSFGEEPERRSQEVVVQTLPPTNGGSKDAKGKAEGWVMVNVSAEGAKRNLASPSPKPTVGKRPSGGATPTQPPPGNDLTPPAVLGNLSDNVPSNSDREGSNSSHDRKGVDGKSEKKRSGFRRLFGGGKDKDKQDPSSSASLEQ